MIGISNHFINNTRILKFLFLCVLVTILNLLTSFHLKWVLNLLAMQSDANSDRLSLRQEQLRLLGSRLIDIFTRWCNKNCRYKFSATAICAFWTVLFNCMHNPIQGFRNLFCPPCPHIYHLNSPGARGIRFTK